MTLQEVSFSPLLISFVRSRYLEGEAIENKFT